MARVNVYLPDELATRAREAGVNVSAVTRAALEAELAAEATGAWLDRAAAVAAAAPGIAHEDALAALDAARDELG
jgi:post-segregation antitoxin (ccd killing protein)